MLCSGSLRSGSLQFVMVAMVCVLRAYALSSTVCLVFMDVAVVVWCSTSADALTAAAPVAAWLVSAVVVAVNMTYCCACVLFVLSCSPSPSSPSPSSPCSSRSGGDDSLMQALCQFDAGKELAWDPVAADLANLDAAVAAATGAAPSCQMDMQQQIEGVQLGGKRSSHSSLGAGSSLFSPDSVMAAMEAGGVVGAAVCARTVQTEQAQVAAAQQDTRESQQGRGRSSSSVRLGSGVRMQPVPITGEGMTANTAARFVRPVSPGARRSSDNLLLLAHGSVSGR